ncbi:MAG: acyl-CoA dehydrogenase family protein [Opitutae bacterium]|nr:acyl-CoA dehydrogenase family protein [Opitutae bacterium]
MSDQKNLPAHLTGGNFLFSETKPELVFTPEDLSSDAREMAATAEKFMDKEVFPHLEALEHREEGLAVKLFHQAAALGLLSLEVPEAYNGLGLGKVAALGVAEQLSRLAGFGITCGAHSGIGTGPITYFGSEAQKQKYLPRLAPGELMAAYCLSEAGSGSDALGMKTKAVLNAAGTHYVLNGAKMWITNGGWADVFIVFAKVDGEHVTAFIVEKTFPGVSTGREEHKLGLKSSSTRRVILEDALVPVENVLGEVGKGAYIAFNILNLGRFTLGAGSMGSAKDLLRTAVKYAGERQQFGRPIASFGLIQHKLGEMAARLYAVESALYRTADQLDQVSATGEMVYSIKAGYPRAIEEFALECSAVKVSVSEMLAYVADEALQIHGGYGFTEEFSPARGTRDARINRIFEGTNEINRLFIPTNLLRRAQRGRLGLMAAAVAAFADAQKAPEADAGGDDLATALRLIGRAKKATLLLFGGAHQKFGDKLIHEQEVLAVLSDLVIDIFHGESAVLRALKIRGRSANAATHADLALIFVNDSVARMENRARDAVAAMAAGEELKLQLGLARKLLRWTPLNTIAMRRRIAARLGTVGSYPALIAAK